MFLSIYHQLTMRIQFNNRLHPHGHRIHGGAMHKSTKHVSNIEKLAKDFSRIYMTPKVKPQKKFVLKL
jgi:hypothetical protein